MKIIKYIIVALVFLAIGFWLGQSYQALPAEQPLANIQSEQNQPSKINNLILVLRFSDTDVREIQNLTSQEGQTVLDLLAKTAQENELIFKTQDYGDLGKLVTQIGDKINGQNNKYWQYWVNGEFAKVGAGQYQLKAGDRIEWKFTEQNFQ